MRAVAITIGIAVGGVILAAGDGTPGCSTPVPRVSFPYAAVLWLPGQPNYVLKTPNSNQHQAEVGVKLGPGPDQDSLLSHILACHLRAVEATGESRTEKCQPAS